MQESEKTALHARFEDMTVDEKLFELAVAVNDPERKCQAVRTIAEDIHGNGRAGLRDEVRSLKWTLYAFAVIAVAWKLLPGMAASMISRLAWCMEVFHG